MKNIVVCLSLLLAFVGCRTSRTPLAPQVSIKDSTKTLVKTVVVEKVRDSLVWINNDEALMTALLTCDSNGNVLMQQLQQYKAGKHAAIPLVSIKNNVLDVRNKVDSFSIFLQWKEKETNTDSISYQRITTTITIIKPVHFLTWWDKLFIKSGKAAWILLLLFGSYKLVTGRFKILNTIRKWVV